MTRLLRSGKLGLAITALAGCVVLGGIGLSVGQSGAFARKPAPRPDNDTTGSAQQFLGDACVRDVEEIYGHIATPPGPDSVCTFSYRVEAISADTSEMKNSVTEVKMSMNRGRMVLESERFSLYRDSSDVFTVIPETRTLFRSEASNRESTSALGGDLSWMRDTLIARSHIEDCTGVLDSAGTRFRRVVMAPDPHARQYFGITRLTLLLDLERREVRSITMVPTGRGMIQKLTWTFSPLSYSVPSEEFLKPVAERFLANGKTLAASWKGYTMVDNRKISGLAPNR